MRSATLCVVLTSLDGREVTGVDEVVAVTGFRPDVSWLSEVHLDLDPELSAPRHLPTQTSRCLSSIRSRVTSRRSSSSAC